MTKDDYKNQPTKHSYLRSGRRADYYYCRFCHERTVIDSDESALKVLNKKESESTYKDLRSSPLTCPSCNNESALEETLFIPMGKELKHKYDSAIHYDNGDKLRLFIFSKEIHFFNDKLQQVPLNTMVVFNIEKGHTYLFETQYAGTRTTQKGCLNPKLMNISTCTDDFRLDFNVNTPSYYDKGIAEFIDTLHSKIQEKFSFPIPTLWDYIEEFYEGERVNSRDDRYCPFSLFILSNYLRMPLINPFAFSRFLSTARYDHNHKGFDRKLAKVRPETTTPIKDFMRAFKVPDKRSLRKVISEDLSRLFLLESLGSIEDINNLVKLIFFFDRRNVSKNLTQFIKAAKEHLPETVIVNKIISSDVITINDTCYLYNKLKDSIADYEVDFSRSLLEIHDTLSLDSEKLDRPNLPIVYTKREEKLESSIGDYTFLLPKDAHQLIEVGTKMRICVGMYGSRAASKDLGIIVAYKDKEPIICFELDRTFKKVVQAKLYRNNRPKDELYDLAMQFINENELVVQTYDLQPKEDTDFLAGFALAV